MLATCCTQLTETTTATSGCVHLSAASDSSQYLSLKPGQGGGWTKTSPFAMEHMGRCQLCRGFGHLQQEAAKLQQLLSQVESSHLTAKFHKYSPPTALLKSIMANASQRKIKQDAKLQSIIFIYVCKEHQENSKKIYID